MGPLPAYKWEGPRAALRTINARDSAIECVIASGRLVLTDQAGDSVQLDCVLIGRNRDYVRLHASKFGRTIHDVTLTPDGLWVYQAKSQADTTNESVSCWRAGLLSDLWSLLMNPYRYHGWRPVESSDLGRHEFAVERAMGSEGSKCSAIIDKRTLATKRFQLHDKGGRLRESVTLSAYRSLGPVIWPMQIDAAGEHGRVRILFDRVDINQELMPTAFTPSSKAKRIQ
jgi:hypothetical protein